jgi:hypothetical protein
MNRAMLSLPIRYRPCIAHRDGRIEPTAVWVVVPVGRGDLPGRSGFTPEV